VISSNIKAVACGLSTDNGYSLHFFIFFNPFHAYVAGRFYVSVVVDIDEKSKYNRDLAIVSNGKTFKNVNKSSKVKRLEKRLRREQRCLSRKYEFKKKKGGKTATASANIEKQKLKVQKLHHRIGCTDG